MSSISEALACVVLTYLVFVAPAVLGISLTQGMCEPSEMSRLRYALGGGVACWLLEPIQARKG